MVIQQEEDAGLKIPVDLSRVSLFSRQIVISYMVMVVPNSCVYILKGGRPIRIYLLSTVP